MKCNLDITLAAIMVISTTPAQAAPNVFWTFGFDRHYLHSTGGRAAIVWPTRLAAATPNRLRRSFGDPALPEPAAGKAPASQRLASVPLDELRGSSNQRQGRLH